MFVLDFIIPQLIGKDINELWNITNPMGLLAAMLKVTKICMLLHHVTNLSSTQILCRLSEVRNELTDCILGVSKLVFASTL